MSQDLPILTALIGNCKVLISMREKTLEQKTFDFMSLMTKQFSVCYQFQHQVQECLAKNPLLSIEDNWLPILNSYYVYSRFVNKFCLIVNPTCCFYCISLLVLSFLLEEETMKKNRTL